MRNAECGMSGPASEPENGTRRYPINSAFRSPHSALRIFLIHTPHSAFGRGRVGMKSHTHYLWFNTKQRQEIIDITDEVAAQVAQSGVLEGFALVSAMHITASVFVNDHESGLWGDILKWLEETVAPWDPPRYRHNDTGEDNAAAHLRSLTIGHEVIVPITQGALDFGPWQRVFYGEWDGQRKKRVVIKVMGE